MPPMKRYVSPLRYPGGKARMAPFLGEMFSQQLSTMDVEVWVEPFAGGGGAGLTLLDAEDVDEVWFTEKHPAIAALWRTILSDGDALAARVASVTPDLHLWAWAGEVLAAAESGQTFTDFELGFAALVVNRCSRSGIVTSNVGPMGGRAQSGQWTVASRWNGSGLADRIRHVAGLSGRIRFNEGDAVDTIAGLDDSGIEDEVLVFVDPPYIREGNRLYANGMCAEDHQRLADALNACPARWLLTYDDEPVVPEVLYPDRRVLSYRIANTANKARIATEYAVMSDNLVFPDGVDLLPGAESIWLQDMRQAARLVA